MTTLLPHHGTTRNPLDNFRFASAHRISTPLISDTGEVEAAIHKLVEEQLENSLAVPVLKWTVPIGMGAHTIGSYFSSMEHLEHVVMHHGGLVCTACGAGAECIPWHTLVRTVKTSAILLFVVAADQVPEGFDIDYYVDAHTLVPGSSDSSVRGLEAVIVSAELPLSHGEEERLLHLLATKKIHGRLMIAGANRSELRMIGYFPYQCFCHHCDVAIAVDAIPPSIEFSKHFEYRLGGSSIVELERIPIDSLVEKLIAAGTNSRSTVQSLCELLQEFGLGDRALSTPLSTLPPLDQLAFNGACMALCSLMDLCVVVDDLCGYLPREEWQEARDILEKVAARGAKIFRLGGPSEWAKRGTIANESAGGLAQTQTEDLTLLPADSSTSLHTEKHTISIASECEKLSESAPEMPLIVASGFYDLIAPNFSNTIEARMNGVSQECIAWPRGRYVCSYCGGTGRIQSKDAMTVSICPQCSGGGFELAAANIEIAGMRMGDLWSLTCGDVPESFFPNSDSAALFELFKQLGFGPARIGFPFGKLFLAEKRRVMLFRMLHSTHSSGNTTFVLESLTPGLSPQRLKTYIALLNRIRMSGVNIVTVESPFSNFP